MKFTWETHAAGETVHSPLPQIACLGSSAVINCRVGWRHPAVLQSKFSLKMNNFDYGIKHLGVRSFTT